jgi:hypothetical protein
LASASSILEKDSRGEWVEHFETVRQRKDGSLVDISLTISPIRNSSGNRRVENRTRPLRSPNALNGVVGDATPTVAPLAERKFIRAPTQTPRPANQLRSLFQTLASIPGVDSLPGLIPRDSVSLLNDPLESFSAAVDLREVIVGQFSPLLLHGAFHLLPISFNPVPIHRDLLRADR